jgi:hypothetical protein
MILKEAVFGLVDIITVFACSEIYEKKPRPEVYYSTNAFFIVLHTHLV